MTTNFHTQSSFTKASVNGPPPPLPPQKKKGKDDLLDANDERPPNTRQRPSDALNHDPNRDAETMTTLMMQTMTLQTRIPMTITTTLAPEAERPPMTQRPFPLSLTSAPMTQTTTLSLEGDEDLNDTNNDSPEGDYNDPRCRMQQPS